jgi:hypothetical protein
MNTEDTEKFRFQNVFSWELFSVPSVFSVFKPLGPFHALPN